MSLIQNCRVGGRARMRSVPVSGITRACVSVLARRTCIVVNARQTRIFVSSFDSRALTARTA